MTGKPFENTKQRARSEFLPYQTHTVVQLEKTVRNLGQL